jgi:hypothetical protein
VFFGRQRPGVAALCVGPEHMRIARIILRIVGGVGFWLWPFLCGLAWLFRGFKPGGAQGGLTAFQGWLCFLAPTVAFTYYLCVAEMRWTRRLFIVGMIVQAGMLVTVITLSSRTDGGFLVAPLLLVGPMAWLFYAVRVRETHNAAQQSGSSP